MALSNGISSSFQTDVDPDGLSKRPIQIIEEDDSVSADASGDMIDHGLRRGLKGRHFVLIALGSIIGPGEMNLFEVYIILY